MLSVMHVVGLSCGSVCMWFTALFPQDWCSMCVHDTAGAAPRAFPRALWPLQQEGVCVLVFCFLGAFGARHSACLHPVCWSFVSLEHLGRGTQHVSILWCGCSSHYQQVEIERVCSWLVSGRKTHHHQPCPFKLCSGVFDVCCCAIWAGGCINSMAVCVCVHKVAFVLLGRHGWHARHASAPTKLGKCLRDQLMFVCLAWSSV